MPVDKFGGSGSSGSSGGDRHISTADLVRKTGDTMLGILSAGGYKITNVGAPTISTDAATKGYADTIDQDNLQLSGGTLTGDLRLNVGTDPLRLLGCTDLTSGKGFSIALGNVQNQLQFAVIPVGQTQTPVIMETTHGFMVRAAGQDVCRLGSDAHKNIVMNNNQIKSMQDPSDPQDAVTKNYVDTSGNFVRKIGDTMTGALTTTQMAIGTSSGGPEIDMRLGGTSSAGSLGYGMRIRRADNLAHCQFAWDAAGFSLYRSDGGVATAVCTLANGRLTALQNPANAQDAATKNYVDNLSVLSYDGHISPMSSNTAQTGFVASASSFFNSSYQPYATFAPQLVITMLANEWVTSEGAGAWLQIQCPARVRLWKIRVRGGASGLERITSWNITGSTDGVFTTLITSTTTLGSTAQKFSVNAAAAYSIYRLNIVAAEPTNTGISHFQIFTRNI